MTSSGLPWVDSGGPTEHDSKQGGSLTSSIVAKERAAWSLAKGPAGKGSTKTADRSRGRPGPYGTSRCCLDPCCLADH